jgi:hypothetical protein
MDLEGRLLVQLSDYEPRLLALAKFRNLVYEKKARDPESRALVDQLCSRYLNEDMGRVLPEDQSEDEKIFRALPHRLRIGVTLQARGYRGDEDELIVDIIAWAAAQSYGRWRQAPWRTLLNELYEPEQL